MKLFKCAYENGTNSEKAAMRETPRCHPKVYRANRQRSASGGNTAYLQLDPYLTRDSCGIAPIPLTPHILAAMFQFLPLVNSLMVFANSTTLRCR